MSTKCAEKGCRRKVTKVIKEKDQTIYHHLARFNHKEGVLTGGLCVVPKPIKEKYLASLLKTMFNQRVRDFYDL